MIKIAAVHPDITGPERTGLGAPRLNAEWVELVNASARNINVAQYFVVNGRGHAFTISLPRRKTLALGPYQSLLIFSGFPDNADDPALCYLSNQALRLFLRRNAYFWDPNQDQAFLYVSRDSYLQNADSYLDMFQYHRRTARVVVVK